MKEKGITNHNLTMKSAIRNFEDTLELENNIKNFQTRIKRDIKSFRKRIIEPGEIQYISKDIDDLSADEISENNYEHLIFRSMEIQYNQCLNISLPLPVTKIFRFTHLTSFAHILESLLRACERRSPIEICFHLRNYLEYSASYSFALGEIIPIMNQFIKNIKIEPRENFYKSHLIEQIPSKQFINLSVKLYKLISVYCWQTNVTKKTIDEFDGNKSIVPDKSFILKSTKITKKLQAFEKKVDLFHPTYDLLSEFLHPNSFTFWSSVDNPGKDQSTLIFRDLNLEESMSIIEYFFTERNLLFLEKVANEIIKRDSEIRSLQSKIPNKLKPPFRKILSFYEYNSNQIFKIKPCVCGSKKLLTECCAK